MRSEPEGNVGEFYKRLRKKKGHARAKEEDVQKIRGAFIKNNHTRFMKSFSYHLPFGSKEAYKEEIKNAGLEKLGHLIKICSFLMQTKVYLFWRRL